MFMHVNNGVYLTLMDLGRTDMMLRAGVVWRIVRQGIYPVVATEAIRFRRSLSLFDRYDLHTEVVWWDDRAVFLRQRFVRRGDIVAEGIVEARFLRRGGGRVDVVELLTMLGEDPAPPPRPDWLDRWHAISRELAVVPADGSPTA